MTDAERVRQWAEIALGPLAVALDRAAAALEREEAARGAEPLDYRVSADGLRAGLVQWSPPPAPLPRAELARRLRATAQALEADNAGA